MRTIIWIIVVVCLVGCGATTSNVEIMPDERASSNFVLEVVDPEHERLNILRSTPTTFRISFEEQTLAWQRVAFFFRHYVKGGSASEDVKQGTGRASNLPLQQQPAYEVQYSTSKNGYKYDVKCSYASGQQCPLPAANLALFVLTGQIDRSMLAQ